MSTKHLLAALEAALRLPPRDCDARLESALASVGIVLERQVAATPAPWCGDCIRCVPVPVAALAVPGVPWLAQRWQVQVDALARGCLKAKAAGGEGYVCKSGLRFGVFLLNLAQRLRDEVDTPPVAGLTSPCGEDAASCGEEQ